MRKVSLSQTSYVHDGTAKRPKVTVSLGGKTLAEGTHYTVSYANNVNPGTASVTVEGRGNYTGRLGASFAIAAKPAAVSLANARVMLSQVSYTYDGSAKKPSVTVELNGKRLAEGVDYSVSYAGNVAVGTARATVTGKGGYEGTVSVSFGIKAASLSGAKVTLAQSSYVADGTAKKPGVTVKLGGKTLASGTDYSVSYSNNVAAGTAKVVVTGKGNYSGTTSATFAITAPAKPDTPSKPEQPSQPSQPTQPDQPSQPTQPSKPSQGGFQGGASTAPAGSWKHDSSGWWYAYDKGGYPANSWAGIGGKWYRFNASGYMQTGWVQVGGTWYYLDSSGARAEGWRSVGGEWYYLRPGSGAMATGWAQVGGTWYYLKSSGAMDHSGWLYNGGKWYWLESSGAMAEGWRSIGGEWYYLRPGSGAMATGWAQVGGTWYYLKGSGAMATGWQQVGGSWYYLRSSGAMAVNTWVDGVYWVGSSGAMATSAWVDNGRYYVGADGVWQK